MAGMPRASRSLLVLFLSGLCVWVALQGCGIEPETFPSKTADLPNGASGANSSGMTSTSMGAGGASTGGAGGGASTGGASGLTTSS